MSAQDSRDECFRQLFRLKQPCYVEPLKSLFSHYDGLDAFLDERCLPEVELAKILKNQKALSYMDLTFILKELHIAGVRVCSNQFKHVWNPYESTFNDFLNQHQYIRVWDEETPSHSPDSLLVMYGNS